ncbi:MAG: hypothetical protein AB1529_06635 [Candidatus Micrarchaeota archaeon]
MGGEKMKANVCEGCCGMCGACGILGGILVLVAGAALFMFGNANLDPRISHMAGGVALALYGVGLLVHALKLCPMCK